MENLVFPGILDTDNDGVGNNVTDDDNDGILDENDDWSDVIGAVDSDSDVCDNFYRALKQWIQIVMV